MAKKSKKSYHPLLLPFVSAKGILIVTSILLVSSLFVIMQSGQRQDFYGNAQVTGLIDCAVIPDSHLEFDGDEMDMLDFINAYRVENGLPEIRALSSLNRAAAWHSIDMNNTGLLSHTDSLGRDYLLRRRECGNTDPGTENIAKLSVGALPVFDYWKNSTDGHKENMLDPQVKYAGVGKVGTYWTVEFAYGVVDNQPTTALPTTNALPSPNCLGSCPTDVPPGTGVNPTAEVEPTQPGDISLTSVPTNGAQPTSGVNPTGVSNPDDGDNENTPPAGRGGFFEIFFGFLLLLLQLFLGLFGR